MAGCRVSFLHPTELNKHGVSIHTQSKVTEIKDRVIFCEKEGKHQKETFDTIIMASGSAPVQTLSKQVKETTIPHTIIGDRIRPGRINDAIQGGVLAAKAI